MNNQKSLICKIVKVLNENKLVINHGSDSGISLNQKFIVYEVGEELFDPDTNQSLGYLEIVKGYGKVVHVQEKMATLESNQKITDVSTKKVVKNNSLYLSLTGQNETITYDQNERTLPFENPKIGDFAKYIP